VTKEGFEDPNSPERPESPEAPEDGHAVTIEGDTRFDVRIIRR
jgi:hypothetical protein